MAECRRSPGTACSEYLEIKNRVDAYQNLRKTYPGGHGLSFANARKTVNFASPNEDIYYLITMTYGDLRSNMGC
jgi:hypothetical protein